MRRLLNSFLYAFEGIGYFFRSEANARVHLLIAIAVTAAGFYFHISRAEWMAATGCIALVVSLEMVNTAIELLCNHVTPERHTQIKVIKDISAGAVLLASLCAAVVGLLIFLPYLRLLFS